jgi:hypothetical protein
MIETLQYQCGHVTQSWGFCTARLGCALAELLQYLQPSHTRELLGSCRHRVDPYDVVGGRAAGEVEADNLHAWQLFRSLCMVGLPVTHACARYSTQPKELKEDARVASHQRRLLWLDARHEPAWQAASPTPPQVTFTVYRVFFAVAL